MPDTDSIQGRREFITKILEELRFPNTKNNRRQIESIIASYLQQNNSHMIDYNFFNNKIPEELANEINMSTKMDVNDVPDFTKRVVDKYKPNSDEGIELPEIGRVKGGKTRGKRNVTKRRNTKSNRTKRRNTKSKRTKRRNTKSKSNRTKGRGKNVLLHQGKNPMHPQEYPRDKCSICLEYINEGADFVETKCKHLFHAECFLRVCDFGVEKQKCPLCRRDVQDLCTEIKEHLSKANLNLRKANSKKSKYGG